MTDLTVKKKRRSAGNRPLLNADRRSHAGEVIRKYRTAAGMDQAALAKYFGYTKTAIGNWELGITRPDIDNIPILCDVLKIPVTELLGIDADYALPVEDQEVLDSYRRLDKFNQRTVCQLMDRLLFQQNRQEKARLRSVYQTMNRYEEAAAAGVGTPMSDYAGCEPVYVLKEDIPHGADCIIHVNGRSMEPTYKNGSYVYVDTGAEIQYGQIGIFIVNGDSFIKEYQPDGLHSHNVRYKTITVSDDTDVRCFGRVLGAVDEEALPVGDQLERIEAAFEEADEDE